MILFVNPNLGILFLEQVSIWREIITLRSMITTQAEVRSILWN